MLVPGMIKWFIVNDPDLILQKVVLFGDAVCSLCCYNFILAYNIPNGIGHLPQWCPENDSLSNFYSILF